MKKILSIFLALFLFTSCSSAPPQDDTNVIEINTSGHAEGLKVETTFTGEKITEVKVLEHNETPGVSDPAIEEIPKSIVENNSIKVDVVSGATNTSNGIIDAVKQAIEKAGLNISDFEKEVSKKTEGEEVTMDTDVVVVGGGIAGLSAGLEAVQNGAKVILLEKMPSTGGSTMMSGGLILGAESSIAKKLDRKETTQDLADYWYEKSEGKVN